MPTDTVFPSGATPNEGEIKDEIELVVRATLNEATEKFWLTSEIVNWIDEGAVDIATKTLCVEDIIAVTVDADQAVYLDTDGTGIEDIIYINAAWIESSNTYEALQKFHPRLMSTVEGKRIPETTTGQPRYISLMGKAGEDKRILLFPNPDASYSLSIFCALAPTSGAIDLPDEYRHLLIPYVLHRAYMKDKAFSAASFCYQQYLAGLGANMPNFFNREQDSEDMLKPPDFTIREE